MSKTNYVWESTVLIAWLLEEASAPLVEMGEVVREIDNGSANLILSVTTFPEILASKFSAAQLDQLEKFLLRTNVVRVDATFRIAKKAAVIRDAGLQEKRKIRTPDATIMATPVMYKVNALHSLEPECLN